MVCFATPTLPRRLTPSRQQPQWSLQLGLWRLGTPTPHFDATLYTNVGRQYVRGDFALNQEHPPLVKYFFGASQWVLGEGVSEAALVSLAAGAAITFFIWKLGHLLCGPVAGAVAAYAWALLPQSLGSNEIGTVLDRPETQALLGPTTALFVVAALAAGLSWLDDERWRWAVAVGVLTGLATASKLTGALVGPPIVLAVLAYRPVRRSVEQATAATGIALGTWAATYVPFGRTANEAVQYLWDNQTGHLQAGHTQYVAGSVYDKPPWWTPFWHQVDAVGWPLALTLGLLVGASLIRWRDRRVAMMLAVAAVLVAALCIAPVKLRHYRYVALPVLYLLAAVGGSELWRRKSALPRVAVGAALAVVLASSAVAVVERLTIEPSDYAAVPAELATAGLVDADVHVFGAPHLQRLYLPGNQVLSGAGPDGMAATSAIVIDRNWEKRNPEVPVGDFLGTRTPIDLGAVVLWLPTGSTSNAS